MQYNFKEIEEKWRAYWLNNKVFKKMNDNFRPRFFATLKCINTNSKNSIDDYINAIKVDSISRIRRMQGFNVLYSACFNSFGNLGEEYALKTGNSPFDYSKKNMSKKIDILKELGLGLDYDLITNTSNPEIYKWSQWLFTKLYENGLTKLNDVDIFYCDMIKKIVDYKDIFYDGKRYRLKGDNYLVELKQSKYWYIDLSRYNERILKDLNKLDYPEEIKEEIREIIGEKEGYNVKIKVDGTNLFFDTFLDRVDNLFGASFCLISPKNKYVLDITNEDEYVDVLDYLNNYDDEISGVFTGSFAINPVNGKLLPIWVSNYFVDEYKNDFKICVPQTDEADYYFSKKFGLDIIKVIDDTNDICLTDGKHINSDFVNDLNIDEANKKIIHFLYENGYGEYKTDYKLKEICLSNPIYFGEPIPVIYLDDGSIKVLNSTELPLENPDIIVKKSGNENSPLYNAKNWYNIYTKDGKNGVRELQTMTNFASLSWYYLAFILRSNAGLLPINSPDAKLELNKWMPLNLYLGNINAYDIIYARFMMEVLSDIKYVDVSNPFNKIIKTKNLDIDDNSFDIEGSLDKYGADVLRLFLLNTTSEIDLIDLDVFRRYIDRLVKAFDLEMVDENINLDNLINDINSYYEEYKYQEIINLIGGRINDAIRNKKICKKEALTILLLLNPICPYVTEELYSEYFSKKNILSFLEWPVSK